MKKFLLLIITAISIHASNAQTNSIDYFGQTPPGKKAEKFAPNIISLNNRMEGGITFSPDGKEVYFSVWNWSGGQNKIHWYKYENNQWIYEGIASFSKNQASDLPFISADDKKMYFRNWQVNSPQGDILMAERIAGGWGSPQRLPSPINTNYDDSGYSESNDGLAYICSGRIGDPDPNYDIWSVQTLPDQSIQVENLGEQINSPLHDAYPCIASDGSYLIFVSSRPGGYSKEDLYISFKNKDEGWTEPINMEKTGAGINLPKHRQICPSLSPDGKYLFFARHDENWNNPTMDIYWVSTSIISDLKELVLPEDIDYFGQTPPGKKAEKFAPNIISLSNRMEGGITFSPDGKEVYFSVWNWSGGQNKIHWYKYENNQWIYKGIASFSKNQASDLPFISADGNKIYFRNPSNSPKSDILMARRILDGWSTPQRLPSPVNSDEYEDGYTETADSIAYVCSFRSGGIGDSSDIWEYNPLSNQIINLGPNVNSTSYEAYPCIAPDGSYLIFVSTRYGGYGKEDLYISFKNKDGEWTGPINMEKTDAGINLPNQHQICPSLSPDGKYLFFARHDENWNNPTMDIYWVSASIISDLKELVLPSSIDYFGQTPPGDTAVVFAPGIISLTNRMEGKIVFSHDSIECYDGYSYYKRENNKWTEQVSAPFLKDFVDPVFSANGKRLYLTKCNNDYSNCDFWAIDRTTGGWGEPQHLPEPINSTFGDYSYTETTDGVGYIYSNRPGGLDSEGDIWCIRLLSDQSKKEENLGSTVNSTSYDCDPCVAPDGSFLIFSSARPGGYGNQDLYICFNKGNSEWTTPVNMERSGAKINISKQSQICPTLSPDGKFLFFGRHNEEGTKCDIYWVSTSIISDLKKIALPTVIDYFGQTPPGDTAVVFAPGIISQSNRKEHRIVFSPDGKECYFTVNGPKIYYTKQENNTWSNQEIASFCANSNASYPFLSADGNKLYFNQNFTNWTENDIWFIERTSGEWSEPQRLPSPVNSEFYDGEYTETNNSVIFFNSNRSGTWDIWCKYPSSSQVVNLRAFINFAYDFSNPCIASDGSYMIFSSYGTSAEFQRLYVSFNKGNNEWTDPIDMETSNAEINLANHNQVSPSISPDGKYLFFSRHNSAGEPFDIYWVSTGVIDKMKVLVLSVDNQNRDRTIPFKIFPNPTKGNLTLSSGSIPFQKLQIKIFNLQGNCVYSKTSHNESNVHIDITDYSSGIYIAKIIADEVSFLTKISKE